MGIILKIWMPLIQRLVSEFDKDLLFNQKCNSIIQSMTEE